MMPATPSHMPLRVRADFSHPVWLLPGGQYWQPSPQAGVQRVLLDRIGAEKARATSLVRYAPGSVFPEHSHPGGEEILVLSGVFSADGQHHPAGSYLRNPPGSRHAPSSAQGCTLLVKLWQMPAHERASVRVDSGDETQWRGPPQRRHCTLFEGDGEHVSVLQLAAGTALFPQATEAAELLVLDGALHCSGGRFAAPFEAGAWLRATGEGAAALLAELVAAAQGARVYLKTGAALLQGAHREAPEWNG